jgi:hypothetical protein
MTNQQQQQTNLQKDIEALRKSDAELRQEGAVPSLSSMKPVTHGDVSRATQNSKPFRFVPLTMGGSGRTHMVSDDSRSLVDDEVTLEDLERMTSLFYDKAFADPTLDQFIRSHTDPHGSRFAKWIHQKLSGSTVWDHDRQIRDLRPVTLAQGVRHVVHDRSSAHAGAWYSPKRPSVDVGRHFQLDECRVWMRLHFWALRESGLMVKSPSFADFYVRFIAHFVRVYESTAPAFARDSLRWSENPTNVETYLANGRRMVDVLGLTAEEAEAQLPESEANDFVWPYNQYES